MYCFAGVSVVVKSEFIFQNDNNNNNIMHPIHAAISSHNVQQLRTLVTDEVQYFHAEVLYSIVKKSVHDLHQKSITNNDNNSTTTIEAKTKELVQLLLDLGANVNAKIPTNPLYNNFSYACSSSTVEIVKLMINVGADFKNYPASGPHPLQCAFQSGDPDKINLFLHHGLTGHQIDRLNLLHHYLKSSRSSTTILSAMLDLGADVSGLNEQGQSTLRCAFEFANCPKVWKLLLDRGCDLNGTGGDDYELEHAVTAKQQRVVEFLLQEGADVERGRHCPLNVAVENGDFAMVKLLLDHGARVQGRYFDRSPMSRAVDAGDGGNVKIVQLLMKRGAEADASSLVKAIERGAIEVVKSLLSRGFNVNCSVRNRTALCWAVYLGYRDIAELLLEHGAVVDDSSSEGGKSAVRYAVDRGDFAMTQLLFHWGAHMQVVLNGWQAVLSAYRRATSNVWAEFLVKQLMLMEPPTERLTRSAANADCYNLLRDCECRCSVEIQLLKVKRFKGSNLSCYDVLMTRDVEKLSGLARNENILRVVGSSGFVKRYPVYGRAIVDNIDRGIASNRDFDLIKRFFHYLATRERNNRLPNLPHVNVDKLFKLLTKADIDKFRKSIPEPDDDIIIEPIELVIVE